MLGRGAVRAAGVEEQVERGEEGAAVRAAQVLDAEGEVRGRLAGGRVDNPQVAAVEEEADRNARRAGGGRSELRGGRSSATGRCTVLGSVEVEGLASLGEIPEEREPRFRRGVALEAAAAPGAGAFGRLLLERRRTGRRRPT